MKRIKPLTLLLSLVCLPVSLPGHAADEEVDKTDKAEMVSYTEHIRPMLAQRCFNCHNQDKAKGGLDLTSYDAVIRGGAFGEVVFAKDPVGSSLLGVMAHTLAPNMPPNGEPATKEQLALVRKWIEQGLVEAPGGKGQAPKRPAADLSVGEAAVGRPDGPPPMPVDLPMGPIHQTPRPGAVRDIATSPWAPVAAIAGQQQVLIQHTQTGELLGVLPFDFGQPETLRFSWTGQLLLVGGGVGGKSGTATLYDIESGALVAQVGQEVDAVLAADLDPTQQLVALGGPSKLVKAYDVATGELRYKLDKHTEWITALAFSPDGKYLATGDRNGGLAVWEAPTGRPVYSLDGHREAVTALAWRFDGKLLASCGEDGQASLWSMTTGEAVKTWNAHGGGARDIAFAEDGRLVTTGRDQRIKLWNDGGNRISEERVFDSPGLSIAIDTTGKAVLAGDLFGELVRWTPEQKDNPLAQWTSNPPTVELALSQAAAQLETRAQQLQQAKDAVEQRADRLKQARDKHAAADQVLNDVRQAKQNGAQQVPRLDKQRNQANKAHQQAASELREARQALQRAQKAMRARQNESDQAKRDHDKAQREADQADKHHRELQQQHEQAKQAAEANPEDNAAAERIASLADELANAERQAQAKAQALEERAEQWSAAQAKVEQAHKSVKQSEQSLDAAQQMAEAREKEKAEADQAYDQARRAWDEAKRGIGSAEDQVKALAERLKQARAAMDEATKRRDAAVEALRAAERDRVKWQAAQLRQQIDALRGEIAAEDGDAPSTEKQLDALMQRYRTMREQIGLGVIEPE